jgi:hypothetical protein
VYKRDSKAIAQNVLTRLRSFKGDWYLNVTFGINWIELLGNLGTENRLLRAVESTVLQTDGVISIQRLGIIRRNANRGVTIELQYTDVFTQQDLQTLELTA